MGRASACRSADGSKSRSRVAVRAVGERVGSEVMAGRKGVAVGLRVDVEGEVWFGGVLLLLLGCVVVGAVSAGGRVDADVMVGVG